VAAEKTQRCRTFRYYLSPTYHQACALDRQLDYQRELYNAALEERIGAWRWERRSVSYIDQCRTLTSLREVRPEVLSSGVTLCRGTLKRLDRAFSAFYRRVKRGETPGFPRFKSARRFSSRQWEDTNGWRLRLDQNRLYLVGIGEIKVNLHRQVVGTPKAITVEREGKKWWLNLRCVDVPADPLPPTGKEVGIDLGIENLVATSDGTLFVGEQFGSRARDQLSLALQALARKLDGSKRRRRQVEEVARLHRKIANQRLNAAHQLSRLLVGAYDFIALEDLAIGNMVRVPKPRIEPNQADVYLPNGAARKAGLNRSIHDAGWGHNSRHNCSTRLKAPAESL
jgi:putative transposase